MADWNGEGGFYESQSGQGEDPWADNAEFDTIQAPSVNTTHTDMPVSFGQLTAPASYKVEGFSTLNPGKG